MKRKSTFKSLLALALAVVLVFSTNITPASAAKKKAKATNAVKSVKVVSPAGTKKIATVARGKSIKLTVTVKAKKKAFKKVTYKSSNAKVATVSKKGIVKGKKVGTTTIKVVSVKNKKKTASIKVKVVKNAVKKVTLNKKNLDLAVGASEKLSAKVNAPKKSYKAVKWTSSNEKVVKVSNKGVVSAVGEGTAKVTVTALDGSKKKATCTVAVWNGIKDVQLNNPRNNYYVDSYKVVLDTPIALTKDSFVVKSKVRAEGTYNRELEVEKVFTNDNLNYTIFTKNSVEMGEFVQVSVPSLKGKNAVELQALADGYEYRQLVSGVVGDEINTGVGFKNLVGYETVSVASGNLPAGLAIEKYTNNIKGKVAAVAENQVVNFTGTDELGRTASSKVNFLIGDKNKVVAENKTIGDQANALIYPHEYIGSYINVEGGSGEYRATLLDTYNDLFYLDSENTDEVFEPIINFLVNHKDQYIFDFHDLMSEFLYELDRKEIYEHSINQEQFNEEDFLNQRAYVLTNGNKYYHDIISLIKPLDGELKCPQLLTLPAKAWSIKNNKSIEKYPHTPKYNIQTKSNTKYW